MPHDVSHDRVLVVGEALVDVLDGIALPGGSPLNVAVGLQRLGVPATLHSYFGADPHGVEIARHLEASGVGVTPGTVGDHATSVAEATLAADGSATYAFAIDWDPAPLEVPPGTFQAVHTGSIGAALEPGATMVEALLTKLRPTTLVTFDPNVRPQLMGTPENALPRIERLIALADVVKASDEDLAWLFPDATIADVMQRWRALGPALIVVTRGDEGADALSAAGPVHVPAVPSKVVDTIGAGDSFMAGLIWSLGTLGLLRADRREMLHELNFADVRLVVSIGARCAGITVSRPGADPPTADEVAATYR
ncbi:MAG: carbohydrate kinase [Pseudolysinimonas sp.]